MIYVTDNLTLNMLTKRNYHVQSENVKKSIFLANTKDAISSIGSHRIARMLHKKVEKRDIKLKSGDIVYIVTSKFGRNKTDYKKENTFRFSKFKLL